MKFIYHLALTLLITLIVSGCSQDTATRQSKPGKKKPVQKITELQQPERGQKVVTGESIKVGISSPDTLKIDSIQVFLRGQKSLVLTENLSGEISTDGMNPGIAGVRLKVFFRQGQSEIHSRQVELLSDIVPTQYRYRVRNSYPHDVGAYTQGLIFYAGWLYEGTGLENQSTIRKVRLETGDIIQHRNNASDIFGEGITIYDGKIYQLTYRAQICYVYDLNTFEEINKFYYQNKEGWGLTHRDGELIMSDGSHIIYFIDPDMFTVKYQIEVYNNEGPVGDLNELEYIDGMIFANRYYTDEIVIIDPETGKETGRVDMGGILSDKDRKPSTNVLNGIAWDKEGRRLFVTGKYWPKLFEIDLVPVGRD